MHCLNLTTRLLYAIVRKRLLCCVHTAVYIMCLLLFFFFFYVRWNRAEPLLLRHLWPH